MNSPLSSALERMVDDPSSSAPAKMFVRMLEAEVAQVLEVDGVTSLVNVNPSVLKSSVEKILEKFDFVSDLHSALEA